MKRQRPSQVGLLVRCFSNIVYIEGLRRGPEYPVVDLTCGICRSQTVGLFSHKVYLYFYLSSVKYYCLVLDFRGPIIQGAMKVCVKTKLVMKAKFR